jgi:predicted lysophospholipase L1 biosynthesis ABC-type transport system permease subunit
MKAGLVSCEQFAALAGLGRCETGAEVASVPPDFTHFDASDSDWGARTWPAAAISAGELRGIPARGLVVGTTGSSSVIERTRTALSAAFPSQPYQEPPATMAELRANSGVATQLAGFQQLTTVVVLGSLCIAGCGLAVSVVGGLNARKRPFSLLRLAGAPLSLLRRIVALESVVPLLVVAVVATASGFLAAGLFLRSQLDYALRAPGAGYYAAVLAGLAVSLGVIGSTLPLLRRITGPETARNE